MEHTPTPWKVGASSKVKIFRSDDLTMVCECDHSQITFEESESNADHIVRCVNSHDALVAALDKISNSRKAEAYELIAIADKALKQAKGE